MISLRKFVKQTGLVYRYRQCCSLVLRRCPARYQHGYRLYWLRFIVRISQPSRILHNVVYEKFSDVSEVRCISIIRAMTYGPNHGGSMDH